MATVPVRVARAALEYKAAAPEGTDDLPLETTSQRSHRLLSESSACFEQAGHNRRVRPVLNPYAGHIACWTQVGGVLQHKAAKQMKASASAPSIKAMDDSDDEPLDDRHLARNPHKPTGQDIPTHPWMPTPMPSSRVHGAFAEKAPTTNWRNPYIRRFQSRSIDGGFYFGPMQVVPKVQHRQDS
mmetsp:Transcript_183/g.486  ORF Transcript_183/g.486 Transcript_183/m.486 type:complete len:184 (-) Transcript_183:136-687(-)